MNLIQKSLLYLIAVACLNACGSGDKSSIQVSVRNAKIINGVDQDPNLSPQILRIDIVFNDAKTGFCTGTVIGTNSILTAGHCFAGGVRFASVTRPDGSIVNVNQAYVHPSYLVNAEIQAIFYDVAVIKTSEPLNLPVLGIHTSTELIAPIEVSIYGYGLDQDGASGTLKSGTMIVETVTPNHLIAVFDGLSNTCNGDSGGPATYTSLDSAGNVQSVSIAGITSSGSLDNCQEGDVSLFTNLNNSEIISFISGLVPEVALQ